MPRTAVVELRALGTTARMVLTDPTAVEQARALLERELERIDRAASRFRPDSELALLQRTSGVPRRVSPLLAEAVRAALWAARATQGAVDPTVGAALRRAGYDRDFAQIAKAAGPAPPRATPAPGWARVAFDPACRTVLLPRGVELDLGATAKALMADRIARLVRASTGAGVLVSLGGDVAVAGARWPIAIAEDHAAPEDVAEVVTLPAGGLATSSTTVRRWTRGGRAQHHIIDPATGEPASTCWRTVSVAATSCLRANSASTAAIVLGERASAWLAARRLPARLVRSDGRVVRVGGWPDPAKP